MAKISIGASVTVNFSRKSIEFMKLDARIEDIDLEIPIDIQLHTLDEKFDYAYGSLRKQLNSKIREKMVGANGEN